MAKMMRVSLLSVARVAAVLIAAAGAGVGAQATRPYRPAFDVTDYDLTIELPDSGAAIRGTAVITVKRTARADSLVLDLLDMHVGRVTVDGRGVSFSRTANALTIPLPSGRAGTYRVAVQYDGTVTDGLIVRTDSAGRWTGFGDNWPDRARHWIPSIDHPSDKATVSWTVRAPEGRTVVANGRLLGTRLLRTPGRATRVETRWRESRPIAVYLMVIAAAPLEMFDLGDTSCGLAEMQRCVPQAVYVAPERRANLPGSFARAGEIVQLFSSLVGPFPYEKLAHLQSSTRFGGMENASAIFYTDGAFTHGTPNDMLVAHETAHQWFGDAVTERDWPHVWLSEGFATYFATLWGRAARGDSAFRVDMERIRNVIVHDTVAVSRRPVIDTTETDLLALLNHNSYEKGGFVLHMLRTQVGERAFFDALRSYYVKHRHATAVTDDLRAEMELESKQQLGWFFDQWLRRPGFPHVDATWSYDGTAREVVVSVTQGGTHGAFRFPLTIAVTDSSGTVHRARMQIAADAAEPTVLRIPLAAPPTAMVLDPDVELLATFNVSRR
jgi:aminopeptidase N